MADEHGKMIYINPAGREMIGLKPDENISKMYLPDFVAESEMDFMLNKIIPDTIANKSWQGELPLRHKSGKLIPASISVQTSLDEHGNIQYFTAIMRDITIQRKKDEEIRKLSTVVEQSPISVVISDLKGEFNMLITFSINLPDLRHQRPSGPYPVNYRKKRIM